MAGGEGGAGLGWVGLGWVGLGRGWVGLGGERWNIPPSPPQTLERMYNGHDSVLPRYLQKNIGS